MEEMQDDGDDPSIDTPSIYDPRLSFSSHIFEYRWPLDDRDSPTYILQEQIAEYLEIRGFSRRYPGLLSLARSDLSCDIWFWPKGAQDYFWLPKLVLLGPDMFW